MKALLKVKGGRISIPLDGHLKRVSPEETRKTFNVYRKYLEQVLSKDEDGKISVNWKKREELIEASDYRQAAAIEEYINTALLSIGILTEKLEGAYTFSDEDLNLRWGMPGADFSPYRRNIVYFVRSEDIDAFACANSSCRSTLGRWSRFKAIEVATKQGICR